MASLAGCWSWLVKEHQISVHWQLEDVAGGTGDILMPALEREDCFLVIEERGPPFVAGVAGGAVVRFDAELIGMGVLVAEAALRGRACEIDVLHGQLHVGRFMAIGTQHSAMGS